MPLTDLEWKQLQVALNNMEYGSTINGIKQVSLARILNFLTYYTEEYEEAIKCKRTIANEQDNSKSQVHKEKNSTGS